MAWDTILIKFSFVPERAVAVAAVAVVAVVAVADGFDDDDDVDEQRVVNVEPVDARAGGGDLI